MNNRKIVLSIAGLLVVLACVVRVVNLDADPYFPTWTQYVVDEGRWNEGARNLALFGASDGSRIGRLHLVLSPGYQAVNYVVFRVFGVEFWTARALAAISGIAIVFAVLFALRRHVRVSALALGGVILAFETNLLAESRLALPEIPSLLGILLAFLVLVLRERTHWNAILAGTLAAVAVAMKGTSVLVVPVLPLIILLSAKDDATTRKRVVRALCFLAGFLIPLVAAASIGLAAGLVDPSVIATNSARILNFLSLADPRFVVWRFFESTQLEVRNLLILGGWFCAWLWFFRDSTASPVTRALYLMSALWAGWWLVLWSINDYSPGRYVVHFVVPATINIMAGLSLGSSFTLARIAESLARRRGLARTGLFLWLVLPSAILVAPGFAGVAEWSGLDVSRASVRIALIAVIAVIAGVLALLAHRGHARQGVIGGFLVFPVVMVLLWLGGRELGVFFHFWKFDSGTSLARWAVLTASTAAACFALAAHPYAPRWGTSLSTIVAVGLALIFLAQGARPVIVPTYSLRDASRQIERQFPGAPAIRTVSASSLFLANKLRYRELYREDSRFDAVVIFEHNLSSQRFLASARAANLVRTGTFPVTFHPRYEFDAARFGPASIAVYAPK